MSDPVELPIGTSLPQLIDQWVAARNTRLDLEKQVSKLEEHETVLKSAIISKLRDANLTQAATEVNVVKMKLHKVPVSDFSPAFYTYIKDNDAFDLLHKRLGVEAVALRTEAGIIIPGVSFNDVYKITPSKRS